MERALEFVLEILVPLVSAYVLYRALPSTASVRGPLKGFKINLQGAFAGYFALVLLVFVFHDKLFPPPPPPPPRYEVWAVNGKISYENGDADKLAGQTTIEMDPPVWKVHNDGTFHAEFATQPGPGEEMAFPVIHIDLADHQHEPVPVYLDGKPRLYEEHQYAVRVDKQGKEIQVEEPIVLKSKPASLGPAYDAATAVKPQLPSEHEP